MHEKHTKYYPNASIMDNIIHWLNSKLTLKYQWLKYIRIEITWPFALIYAMFQLYELYHSIYRIELHNTILYLVIIDSFSKNSSINQQNVFFRFLKKSILWYKFSLSLFFKLKYSILKIYYSCKRLSIVDI